ncbi:MAG TPA: hypothetical protein VJH03_17480 [Blastocatellia bacterium]|nr:hypothetical protein [Blastocatellia bacterium]
MTMLADRSDIFFSPGFTNTVFLRASNVAVRVGTEWRFFDPATTYAPYGMLRWQEEGQEALITDPKESVFVNTPMSPPEKSIEKRTATLRLSDDGTLEGEVRIEYSGHLGLDRKEINDDDSPSQREDNLREMIKDRMSTAEISQIKIENVADPVKPFTYSFHIRVPGYAQRTGKRLFLQPAFFQKGVGPLFPTSERKQPIYFHYPWSETDVVTIDLPEGFALDNADQPAEFNVPNVGAYLPKIGVTKDGRTLEYKRSFRFCANGVIYFDANVYPNLKRIFDTLHERDNHTLTLKQAAAAQ